MAEKKVDSIMPSIVCHHLNLNEELPEEIYEIAVKQGENPHKKCELIEELRNMIFEKGEFTPSRTDNAFLIKFLRCRFWSVENAYKLFVNYNEFREKNRYYHEKVRPKDLHSLGDYDIVSVAPYRDQNDRRIITYRFGNWKPNKVPIDDIFKATLILLELGSLEPIAQIMGGVGIFDMEGLSLNHVLNLTPSVAQKMIALIVTSMPMRTTAIHIVNQNWVFSTAFNIFKPFLSTRMKESIFIHGSDMSSLHKHILPEYLPKRYGGKHDDYPYTIWLENINKNKTIIHEMEQLGYIMDSHDDLQSS